MKQNAKGKLEMDSRDGKKCPWESRLLLSLIFQILRTNGFQQELFPDIPVPPKYLQSPIQFLNRNKSNI